jgi:hypothetical protein
MIGTKHGRRTQEKRAEFWWGTSFEIGFLEEKRCRLEDKVKMDFREADLMN